MGIALFICLNPRYNINVNLRRLVSNYQTLQDYK